MAYVDQLTQIPKNVNLYDIYAYDKPRQLGGKESLIGTLKLEGQLIKSSWGDQRLFFRHQKMSDDLEIHPEWKPYVRSYKLGGLCPYMIDGYQKKGVRSGIEVNKKTPEKKPEEKSPKETGVKKEVEVNKPAEKTPVKKENSTASASSAEQTPVNVPSNSTIAVPAKASNTTAVPTKATNTSVQEQVPVPSPLAPSTKPSNTTALAAPPAPAASPDPEPSITTANTAPLEDSKARFEKTPPAPSASAANVTAASSGG